MLSNSKILMQIMIMIILFSKLIRNFLSYSFLKLKHIITREQTTGASLEIENRKSSDKMITSVAIVRYANKHPEINILFRSIVCIHMQNTISNENSDHSTRTCVEESASPFSDSG